MTTVFVHRWRALPALCVALLCSAGCWTERVAWSPDGSRAVVLTPEQLYLTAGDGRLTPLDARDVYRVAWLSDSEHIVVARRREVTDVAAMSAALGIERTEALIAKAEKVWRRLEAGIDLEEVLDGIDILGEEVDAIGLLLRSRHGEALREKLGEAVVEEEPERVLLHSVVVARLAAPKLELGPTLHEGFAAIEGIRPAPGGRAVAFVTQAESLFGGGDLSVSVVPVDASSPAVLLDSHTSASVDWTPDGRSVVYLRGSPFESRYTLGWLTRNEVLTADGRLQERSTVLATTMFARTATVRSLRDGRILFNTAEFHLPGKAHEPSEQLFAFDPARPDAAAVPLIPAKHRDKLPDALDWFEVSPDASQVLFAGRGGDVLVLTLADGTVEWLQQDLRNDATHHVPKPAWRRAGEFSYLKRGALSNELVLRLAGSEVVVSRWWTSEMMEGLLR